MGVWHAKCVSTARLDGKIAVITGCNTGIGKVTAKDFYLRGAKVIMACRNMDKANAARDQILEECTGQKSLGSLETAELDLGSLRSIRICAEKLKREEPKINLLINNAGVMACPLMRTEDGFEMQLGTNHLGHFLLTLLLMPKIVESTPARVVNVSSVAHSYATRLNFDDLNWNTRKYSAVGAYKHSKLANVMFTKELDKRLKEANVEGVTVYSLHPGVIRTELGRHLRDTYSWGVSYISRIVMGAFSKTPLQGAQTTMHCAVSEQAANESGLYYAECKPAACNPAANSQQDCQRLWTESLKLVGLDENYDPFKTNES